MVRDVERDADLIRTAQLGNAEAMAEVGSWMTQILWDFYSNYFSRDLVHDLTNETFAEIWPKLGEFDTTRPEPFENWVRSCGGMGARRQTQRWGRSAARRAKLHRVWVWSSQIGCETAVDKRRQRELFYKCLELLPSKYRRVLEQYLAGGSDESYAQREGIARATVRAQRMRALEMMRQLIEREQGGAGYSRSSSSSARC